MRASLAFLALAVSAPVHAQAVEADVLAHAVARGEILQASDFVRRDIPLSQQRFVLRAEQAVGKETRRVLSAGTALRAGDVMEARLVHRGDAVTLRLQSGALTITAPGKALADAGAGEAVRALNLSTGRTLDARVRAPGEVEIIAP